MNILLVASVYPSPNANNENVTKVVRYFAQEWVKQGHTVKVIHNAHRYFRLIHDLPKKLKQKIATKISFYIPDYNEVRETVFDDNGIEVFRFPIFKFIPHGGHSHKSLERQVKKIERALADCNFTPDIIMGHWMNPQLPIIAELKDIYHCRTSLVLHGRGYIDDGKFDCRKYLPKLDALGCRSNAEADFVQKALNLKKKPYICYSGIPDAFLEKYAYQNKFMERPKIWRFIYVGRLVQYKHIDKVLIALSKLKEYNYVFDIIGTGGEEENLKKLSAELDIENRVVFHGRMPREKVLEYMSNAHCFTMISKGEIFGLVYLEAMATSCITVGAKDEGIDGVIEDGKNGFLCRPADADALSQVLYTIMTTPVDDLQRYARAGFETAQKFTDSNVAEWYLKDATTYGDAI